LLDREVDVDERVAVTEGGCVLRTVVQADRNLGSKLPPDRVVSFQPRSQTTRDDAEQDVVDRGGLWARCADGLHVGDSGSGEGELPRDRDGPVERRWRA